ncbi:probable aminopeptidase NPEPL1 [Battus philenor]|uniref:probable aminopeptidase NPEPL1 n=1 Tax=Battus philenor TaxID=42288 RepID=UPI0035CF1CD6
MLILNVIPKCVATVRYCPLKYAVCRMSGGSVNVKFRWGLSTSDPETQPVLIVGQAVHLNTFTWQDVRCKLEPRVSEEVWQRGLSVVAAGEACELWPRGASLAALPSRRSRHAAPSRAHALSKIVKAAQRTSATEEFIVLVCKKQDVLASAVGIARAVPQYSARSGTAPLGTSPTPPAHRDLTVEIVLVTDEKREGDSEDEDTGPVESVLMEKTLSDDELGTIQRVADATRLAARITDTPANQMHVQDIIEEACKVAKELNIAEPTIIQGEELRERGMGGIYGVGRAASKPPALVSLTYRAPGATQSVAWVGKGIVYDTGGLSIKARSSMVGMKGDCGGAAAVLGAFAAFVAERPTIDVHAVLCLAENAVGPDATRPDDIHQLYSGRTVEINNTDAEGRLVLSDGVVYAQRDLKADTIVDVATLTGAQGTATGKYHAAVLSNCGRLERRCVTAGLRSGELAHAVPFAPELHFPEFSSAVADMKNSVADRNNAQPSCAGLFILAHLGFDFRGAWLHVDMAAPAHSGERATGYGVALLNVLFGAQSGSRLLRALAPPALHQRAPLHTP